MLNTSLRTLSVLALSLLTGIRPSHAKADIVTESEVKNCRFISTLSASSGYGKNPQWQSIAKRYAERKAEGLGATHLVITNIQANGSFNGSVDGKAYACP